MTQEQKAKAYDEALERMKSWAKGEHPECFGEAQKAAEFVFPELKESEDESIRKSIINLVIKSAQNGGMALHKWESQQMLAWLKKQGEQNIPIEKLPFEMKTVSESLGFTTQKECDDYNKIVTDLIMSDDGKGEQKPADVEEVNFFDDFRKTDSEVEPKFHEGDWTTSNLDGKARQISEVHFNEYNSYYVVDGQSVNLEEYDRLHHLWTIQDAKDGDVLATEPIEGFHSPFVAIYKKQNEEDFGSYCFIWFDGKFYKGEDDHSTEEVHPATKEQRDTLFAKMKEAGYEWDDEKKELKKIIEEVNGEDYGIDGLYHAQRILEKTLGKVDGYQSSDGLLDHKAAITAVKKLYEQKSDEWSEEDERMYTRLHNLIYYTPYCNSRKELSDFLNSLKNKLQSNLQL